MSFYRRWIVACAAGEFVGIGAAAGAAIAIGALIGDHSRSALASPRW